MKKKLQKTKVEGNPNLKGLAAAAPLPLTLINQSMEFCASSHSSSDSDMVEIRTRNWWSIDLAGFQSKFEMVNAPIFLNFSYFINYFASKRERECQLILCYSNYINKFEVILIYFIINYIILSIFFY